MKPAGASSQGEEKVAASIVSDAQFKLALDKEDQVRPGRYTCLSPSLWHPDFKPKRP